MLLKAFKGFLIKLKRGKQQNISPKMSYKRTNVRTYKTQISNASTFKVYNVFRENERVRNSR